MFKEPIEYIKHIKEECNFIISVSQNLTQDEFMASETLKRAIVRSLEIIGEATKKVPAEFRLQYSFIQWKNMAGMRDRLIYDYIGVNYLIVWDVIKTKIPELHIQISEILQ